MDLTVGLDLNLMALTFETRVCIATMATCLKLKTSRRRAASDDERPFL